MIVAILIKGQKKRRKLDINNLKAFQMQIVIFKIKLKVSCTLSLPFLDRSQDYCYGLLQV